VRVVHREQLTPEHTVVPLCGVWRSLDEDWTTSADGVTCAACRAAGGGAAVLSDPKESP
jgi:hypothetical protein